MTQLPQGEGGWEWRKGGEGSAEQSRKGPGRQGREGPGGRTEKGPRRGRIGGGRGTRSSAANYLWRIKHSTLYAFSWYLTDQCASISKAKMWIWFRRFIAFLPPRRTGFDSMSVHLRFVMDKVAWGRVFLRVLQFTLSVSFHQCYTPFLSSLTLFNLGNWHLC